jgi:hypothetical protein
MLWARPAARASQSPVCAHRAGAPVTLLPGKAAISSCGWPKNPPASANSPAADTQTAGAPPPAPAAACAIPRRPPGARRNAATAGQPNHLAGLALTHPKNFLSMSNRIPLYTGHYHFFVEISFKIALSSIASARNFFSLAFSSFKAFRRFALETSRPPYLDFYL